MTSRGFKDAANALVPDGSGEPTGVMMCWYSPTGNPPPTGTSRSYYEAIALDRVRSANEAIAEENGIRLASAALREGKPVAAGAARRTKAKHVRGFIRKQSHQLYKPRPDSHYPTRFPGLNLSLQCPAPQVMGHLVSWPGIFFEWMPDSFLAYNQSLGCAYYSGFRLKKHSGRISKPDEFAMGDYITIENEFFVTKAQIVSCYQATNPRIFLFDDEDGNKRNVQEKGE